MAHSSILCLQTAIFSGSAKTEELFEKEIKARSEPMTGRTSTAAKPSSAVVDMFIEREIWLWLSALIEQLQLSESCLPREKFSGGVAFVSLVDKNSIYRIDCACFRAAPPVR